MYTIKSRSDNQRSVISQYPDYRKTSRKNHVFNNCMGHGNDIAYHSGKLYVAPCDKYVQVVDVKTWEHHRLYCSVFLSGIAHWSGNQFIGWTLSPGARYTLVLLDECGDCMNVIRQWDVANPKFSEGYSVCQAMGVKKSNQSIFAVFSNQDFHSNVILRSKLYYTEPDYCFVSKRSSGRYEFEGISFNTDNKKIIGANLPSGGDCTFIAK